jgi:hypothetical protein
MTLNSRKKLCGLLTSLEAEVLAPLHANRTKYNSVYTTGVVDPGWCRCRDIGGERDSHHSLTLRRLARKGLVDTAQLAQGRELAKPLIAYRISPEGQRIWAEYCAYLQHARIAHPKDNRTRVNVRGAELAAAESFSLPN